MNDPRDQAPAAAPAATGSFDGTLGQLKQIVDRLEGGQLSLEAALAAFEEGVRLARQGAQILDAAERRVEVLTRAPGPGEGSESASIAPFADE